MKKNVTRLYVAPSMEIIPVAPGSVMAASPGGGLDDFGPGDDLFPTSSSSPTSARSTAGRNDVESMISDILTVGQ
jgi:hypothetical protein